MSYLPELVEFDLESGQHSALQEAFDNFTTAYDTPGREYDIISSADIAHSFTSKYTKYIATHRDKLLKEINEFDHPTILLVASIYNSIKIITRTGQHAIIQPSYDRSFFETSLELIESSAVLYRNAISTPNARAPLATVSAIIKLRLEGLRLLQNLTILSSSTVSQLIDEDEKIRVEGTPTILQRLLHIYSTLLLPQSLWTDLLAAQSVGSTSDKTGDVVDLSQHDYFVSLCEGSVPVGSLLGLTDILHISRMLHFLTSTKDTAVQLASYGFVAHIYRNVLLATSIPVVDPSVPADINNAQQSALFDPGLLFPEVSRTLTLFCHNYAKLGALYPHSQLTQEVRSAITELFRSLLVFSIHGGEDADSWQHWLYEDASGDDQETTRATTTQDGSSFQAPIPLFNLFIERCLWILSLGHQQSDILPELRDYLNKMHTDDVISAHLYITPIDNKSVGFSRPQFDIITEFNEAHHALIAFNPLPSSPPPQNTFTHLASTIAKVISRLPLDKAPFLALHGYAFQTLYRLFEAGVTTFAPPEPNTDGDIKRSACKLDYSVQIAEILPWLQCIVNFVSGTRGESTPESSPDRDGNSAGSDTDGTTKPNAVSTISGVKSKKPSHYTKSTDVTAPFPVATLSHLCKVLIFGKYANPTTTHHYYEYQEILQQQEQKQEGSAEATTGLSAPKVYESGSEIIIDEDAETDQDDSDQKAVAATDTTNTNTATTSQDDMSFSELLKTSAPSEATASQQYDPIMVCAGGYTERLLDTQQNTSFRSRCLMLMLYSNSEIASALQQLVYLCADEDADEFIRLCGLGRALGLLVNKQVPGYAHFANSGISLDSLFR